MIYGVEGVDPDRRAQLVELLEIDPEWRLNKVSDGQRRRVQICMGLLKPYQVRLVLSKGLPGSARNTSLHACTCMSCSMASCCGPVEAALWPCHLGDASAGMVHANSCRLHAKRYW